MSDTEMTSLVKGFIRYLETLNKLKRTSQERRLKVTDILLLIKKKFCNVFKLFKMKKIFTSLTITVDKNYHCSIITAESSKGLSKRTVPIKGAETPNELSYRTLPIIGLYH